MLEPGFSRSASVAPVIKVRDRSDERLTIKIVKAENELAL